MTEDVTRVHRFLTAYAGVEQVLSLEQEETRSPRNWEGFIKLVNRSDKLLRSQKDALRQIAKLRNAISHNDYLDGKPIAYPRLDVVEKLERILEMLETPPLLVEALPDRAAPQILSPSDDLRVFLELVTEHDFSQAPVLGSDGYDLITTNAVARWFAPSLLRDGGDAQGTSISEALAFAEPGDRVQIVNPMTTAVQAINIFAGEAQAEPEPPSALLVLGKMGQAPQLLCTPSDLGDLYAAVSHF